MQQLKLNFEPGLLERFETLDDVIEAVVSDSGRQKKWLAAELGLSPDKVSRMMPGGDLKFPTALLSHLMEITNDHRPIYWMAEKFLRKPQMSKEELLQGLHTKMDALLKEVSRIETI